MEKKTIELNAEEAQVLINLLNIANKAVGLEAAEACLHFTKKLKEVFDTKTESVAKEESKTTAIEEAVEVK